MSAGSVLIVEDDADIRALLGAFLQDENYSVFVAPDGQPALERMRKHSEGLVVLLDLMMPGMDGYAVLQVLAADSPLATKHSYILMTASGELLPENVRQLLKHLHVPLLPKPFELDDLLAAIQQAAKRLS